MNKEVVTYTRDVFFPPAAFLKRLESCYSVEKGKKIVLRCEVVDPNVQVKWLKNGQEIKPSAKYVLRRTKTLATLEHAAPCLFLKLSFIGLTSLKKNLVFPSHRHMNRAPLLTRNCYIFDNIWEVGFGKSFYN